MKDWREEMNNGEIMKKHFSKKRLGELERRQIIMRARYGRPPLGRHIFYGGWEEYLSKKGEKK